MPCVAEVVNRSLKADCTDCMRVYKLMIQTSGGGSTPILGHIGDVRPEWVSFPGRKPADGCKFLTKNLRMGHNFDINLPDNGWFSSKLN